MFKINKEWKGVNSNRYENNPKEKAFAFEAINAVIRFIRKAV